jgi:hypothetical protein
MVSTISKSPILDAAAQMLACGAMLIDSWPPATTMSAVAVEDRLIAERDRAQARAAELVDAPGRAFHRDAGGDRGLAGRVLALRRRSGSGP